MSGLDKLGDVKELQRVMASDTCQACGSMLMQTPDGAVCMTCQIARSGGVQGEPAWDEYRREASVPNVFVEQTSQPEVEASVPVEPAVDALPVGKLVTDRDVNADEVVAMVEETRQELVAAYQRLAEIVRRLKQV